MERWATFDCYGTLVDWNAGIHRELEKLFGVELADGLLVRFHELEPQIQVDNPGASYREVLTVALETLAAEAGLTLPEGETSVLAHSLPSGRCSTTCTTDWRRRVIEAGGSASSPTRIGI